MNSVFDFDFVPKCLQCGKYMIATSRHFVCCPDGHGRLYPRCRRYLGKQRALRQKEARISRQKAEKSSKKKAKKAATQ